MFAWCIILVELPADLYPPPPTPLHLPRTEGDVSYTICVSLNCYWDDVYRVHDAWGTACLQNYPRLPHSTEWDVSYYIDIYPKSIIGLAFAGCMTFEELPADRYPPAPSTEWDVSYNTYVCIYICKLSLG